MSLATHSKFYYGFEIDETNQYLDFNEGSGELSAELEIGLYSFTDYCAELARALNAAGGSTYTVTGNRTTRKITIAATGTFSLLVSSGSHEGTSAFATAGFTGADRSGSASYEGAASGSANSHPISAPKLCGPRRFPGIHQRIGQ